MLRLRDMPVLEARFHPLEKTSPTFVLVGHLIWDGKVAEGAPSVRPAASLAFEKAPLTILSKLQHLVAITAPDSFGGLKALKSRYWSLGLGSPK